MCLSDQDLIELINIKEKEEQPTAEFLSNARRFINSIRKNKR